MLRLEPMLAGSDQFELVLPAEQGAFNLGLLEVEPDRWQLAIGAAEVTPDPDRHVEAKRFTALVDVRPLAREVQANV